MPFKSEAQRRYLWANEPEIARDWTDTYGSRIQAALGGIMASRVGLRGGGAAMGDPGKAQERADRGYGQTADTGSQRGDNDYSTHAQNINHNAAVAAAMNKGPTLGQKIKSGISTVGNMAGNYIKGGGMLGMGIRGLTNLFGGPPTNPMSFGQHNIPGYNQLNIAGPVKGPGFGPDNDGPQQEYPPWWYDNAYAQNVMEEDDIDIDTSTGNMEDWSQRFRVDDQYRQDKEGQLDPQIIEMISKLYR